MNSNCYDCTKLIDDSDMVDIIEGTRVKVIRKVCFSCFHRRERADKNIGNWKNGEKTWTH